MTKEILLKKINEDLTPQQYKSLKPYFSDDFDPVTVRRTISSEGWESLWLLKIISDLFTQHGDYKEAGVINKYLNSL